ncbi:MAG: BatD family protein [Legionella sp.]|nr:BatD family protein [Legionella sp.]
MKKCIVFILCVFSCYVHADIQVEAMPNEIAVDEAFQLKLTQESPKNAAAPNLSVLQKEFTILETGQQATYTIINGQSHSSRTWLISLKPKHVGQITIPAIDVGSEQTKPLLIKVSPSASKKQTMATQSTKQEDVLLRTEVDNLKPFVNQQIIYKVRLYNSKRLLDADYIGPQSAHALLFPLGAAKHYQTLVNNTNYLVEEQTFAIFPQKSGVLNIITPKFTALVYDYNPRKIIAQDKNISLQVAPIPKSYKGQEWVPASQMSLSEQFEKPNQSITQGSTLIRDISIQGTALPAQLLPRLTFKESEFFNVYAEKGKEYNQIKQDELVGSSAYKVTYLFKKPGTVVIPELKISWFNTTTAKEEVAFLPAKTIQVLPPAISAVSSLETPTSLDSNKPLTDTTELATENAKPNHWMIFTILFAVAWVVTLMLWIWQRSRKSSSHSSYSKALKELRHYCRENNPVKARDALLKWASFQWPDAVILNLNDLNQLTTDGHFKKQLHLLSQAIYGNNQSLSWHGQELFESVQALKQSKERKGQAKPPPLPPMNPVN